MTDALLFIVSLCLLAISIWALKLSREILRLELENLRLRGQIPNSNIMPDVVWAKFFEGHKHDGNSAHDRVGPNDRSRFDSLLARSSGVSTRNIRIC